MSKRTYQVDDTLRLCVLPTTSSAPTTTTVTKPPIDHAFVCDVSGSMYSALPRMASHICDEIGRLIGPDDTFSLIVFSGRRECETVLRAEKIASLTDLSGIKAKVKQYLHTIGLTGFVDPLKSIGTLAQHLQGLGRSTLSVLFLTDGGDNQWDRSEILSTLTSIKGVASWTFVQYGAWADGPFLSRMAESVGGSVVFANDFPNYTPVFEAQFGKTVSAKMVSVDIHNTPIGGVVFGVRGQDIVTFASNGGDLDVPADMEAVYYLTDKVNARDLLVPIKNSEIVIHAGDSHLGKALYAAVTVFAQRAQSKVVLPILRALGDKALCEKYSRAFGQVLIGEFANVASRAANGEGRYEAGYDPKAVPAADAFTILDLVRALADDDGNRFLAQDPAFKYSPIGRRMVDANELLTPEEQAEFDKLNDLASKAKSVSEKKRFQTLAQAILDKHPEPLKFVADQRPDGFALQDIVLNAKHPNISFLIYIPGEVDISSAIDAKRAEIKAAGGDAPFLDAMPTTLRTSKFKNYAIVGHGVTNFEVMPCVITEKTWKTLAKRGVVSGPYTDGRVDFDLKSMPVINQNMVTDVSAKTLFEAEYEIKVLGASRKVYDHFLKSLFPSIDEKMAAAYGEEATRWLETIGFKNGGFNPLRRQADPTDEIMGKELPVLIEGLSATPSVTEVVTRANQIDLAKSATVEPGKKAKKAPEYTTPMRLLVPALEAVQKKLGAKSSVVTPLLSAVKDEPKDQKAVRLEKARSAVGQDAKLKSFLEKSSESADERIRELQGQVAQIKFAVAVGQVWPVEFGGDLNKNSLTFKASDGNEITGVLTVKPFVVKI